MAGKRLRVILVIGSVIIAALVYLAPKNQLRSDDHSLPEQKQLSIDEAGLIRDARLRLSKADSEILKELEAGDASTNDTSSYRKLVGFWTSKSDPGTAGLYLIKIAKVSGSAGDWSESGSLLYQAFRTATDSLNRAYLSKEAVKAYEKALELKPGDPDIMTALAACYVEGSNEPMKGITMLREVVAEHPDHVNAQLNLGFFSIRSGQYEKALERFNNVLKANPDRVDVYLYLGETQLEMGRKEEALKSFETFKSLSKDKDMIRDVDHYIDQIKNSNN